MPIDTSNVNNEALLPTNPGERQVIAIILADASVSMAKSGAINELNAGLKELGVALNNDALAKGRADICIISFNSTVQVEMPFRSADKYEAPTITASGFTSLNEGINVALDMIRDRKQIYKDNGISYYRPWLFVLTDGSPTDEYMEEETKSRLRDDINNKKVVYLPMGIGKEANIQKLQEYYPENAESKPVLKAEEKSFKDAFQWLSNSIGMVASSNPATTSEINTPPLPSSIKIGI